MASTTIKVLRGSILAALLGAGGAQAAIVSITGNDLIFTYDDATAYGAATVVGNTIFFNPTNFKAESLNGAGAVTSNATLNIDIQVKSGSTFTIDGVRVAEQGDYKLVGSGASVQVGGQLALTSLTQINPGTLQPYRWVGVFNAGALTQQSVNGQPTPWSAAVDASIDDVAGWDSDNRIRLTLENLLTATTFNLGEQAFVEKKFNGIGIHIVSEVPVPAALWLFGSALAALGLRRRAGA